MKRILILLAHQDDEYFAAPWIRKEIAAGNEVACVYMTDGGSRTNPVTRDKESRESLASLGIPPECVAFLGGDERIPDGRLIEHLEHGYALVDDWLNESGFEVQRIYAPDFEGGHPDHDATHVIALALAKKRGIELDSWGFALYNACGCPKPVFRTLNLLRQPYARTLTYSVRDGWRYANLCWYYPSQRRTWLGLFPESLLRRVLLRKEMVNRFDHERTSRRPHEGELLYERMFGVSYDEFARAASAFAKSIF